MTYPKLRFQGVFAYARTTIQEALHDRILYVLLLFGIGLVLLSGVLSGLTLGYRLRIVTDFSMTALTFTGTVIAGLLGVSTIRRELDRRTAHPLLAKPFGRTSYILGKTLGVVSTSWLTVTLMMVFATAMIALYSVLEEGGRLFTWANLLNVWLLLLFRVGIVATIATSFAAVVSATVALIATVGITISGYLSSDLRYFLGQSDSPTMRFIGELLYRALPDFRLLDPLGQLIHGQAIMTGQVALGLAYAVAYSAILLYVSTRIVKRRDLT